jgi:hypothetical protein
LARNLRRLNPSPMLSLGALMASSIADTWSFNPLYALHLGPGMHATTDAS